MTFASRTLQQKVNGKWQPINVITDPGKISALLTEELTVKYIFKRKRQVRKIQYTGLGIIVTFDRKTKAVYTK